MEVSLSKTLHIAALSIFALIMIEATIVRFANSAVMPYSNDELSALDGLQFDDFSTSLESRVKNDGHPAGVHALLWVWTSGFGYAENVVRLPFILFGIGSVFMLFLLAYRWFGKLPALICTASLALLAFPVFYSQMARPYSPGLFLVLVNVWFWWDCIWGPNQPKRWKWVAYVISGALALYVHQFSGLMVMLVGLTGFLFINRRSLFPYLLCLLSIGLLFIPHLPITLAQLETGGLSWMGTPEPSFFTDHLYRTFNASFWLTAAAAIIFLAGLICNPCPVPKRPLFVCMVLFFLPMLIGYTYSVVFKPVLLDRVLIFSFPFLLLLGSSTWAHYKKPAVLLGLPLLWNALLVYSLIWGIQYYQRPHFMAYEPVANKLGMLLSRQPFPPFLVLNGNTAKYIDWYLKESGQSVSFDFHTDFFGENLAQLEQSLDTTSKGSVIYVRTFADRNLDVERYINSKFPVLVESYPFYEAEITIYKRTLLTSDSTAYINRRLDIKSDDEEIPILEIPVSEIAVDLPVNLYAELTVRNMESPDWEVFVIRTNPGGESIWKGSHFHRYFSDPITTRTVWNSLLITPEFLTTQASLNLHIYNPSRHTIVVEGIRIWVEPLKHAP